MPVWGANLNVGDSINFDVVIRNQQVGNVNITVGEYLQGPDQGRRGIGGEFTVTKQPTLGQHLSFTHFSSVTLEIKLTTH